MVICLFIYKNIIEDVTIIKNVKYYDKIAFKCEKCNKSFETSKKNVLRRIRSGITELFCSNVCRKGNDEIIPNVECMHCHTIFYKKPSNIRRCPNHFCSTKCHKKYYNKLLDHGQEIDLECKWCGVTFIRNKSLAKRQKVHLCSYKCSSHYKESVSRKGKNRSKFELYTEERLIKDYPYLSFKFNDKTMIGRELDIFIETLDIAFEINGPYHYKPIKGFPALNKTICNDIRKICDCERNGISLHILDISNMRGATNSVFDEYYKDIKQIIDTALTNTPIDKTIVRSVFVPHSKRKRIVKPCPECSGDNETGNKYCSIKCTEARAAKRYPLGDTNVETIIAKFKELGCNYLQTGRYYGVSDNAIRKRIKSHLI